MRLRQALHKQALNEHSHKQPLGYPRGNHRPRHFSVRIGWRLRHVTGRRGPAFEVGLGAPPAGRAAQALLRRRGLPRRRRRRGRRRLAGRGPVGGWRGQNPSVGSENRRHGGERGGRRRDQRGGGGAV